MEEEKAAAYYDELTRKGGGAARFKQGLGFSSATSNDTAPSKGSAFPSASSFLSSFVRASSPSKTSELEQQAQLESIQNKLKKKPKENQHTDSSSSFSRVSKDRDSDRHSSRGSRSRSRSGSRSRDKRSTSRYRSRSTSRDRKSSRRSRSRSRDRNSRRRSRSQSRDRHSRRRRSRSQSRSRDEYRSRRRSRSTDRRRRERSRSRSRSGSELSRRRKRSESPPRTRDRKAEKSGKDGKEERNGGVDYAKVIEGYDKMTPAERVKAKMKLQLSETAEKDPTKVMGSKWERFDFDKDAPLDDEEIEAAEDDATLVKNIGQSFRFSAVEAKREEQIKAAHDEAMFGAPSLPSASETDEEEREDSKKETNDSAPVAGLISEQVLSMQQGSWRDRVRKT